MMISFIWIKNFLLSHALLLLETKTSKQYKTGAWLSWFGHRNGYAVNIFATSIIIGSSISLHHHVHFIEKIRSISEPNFDFLFSDYSVFFLDFTWILFIWSCAMQCVLCNVCNLGINIKHLMGLGGFFSSSRVGWVNCQSYFALT